LVTVLSQQILAGIEAANDLGDAVTLFRAVLGHKDASWEDRVGAHHQLYEAHDRWLLAARIATQAYEEAYTDPTWEDTNA
jgi:hypothetical protein